MFTKRYRLIDIARPIDRDKSTIIRWEDLGLIPKARRDSRGWRYYTEEEAKKIIELVKKTNYFRDALNGSNGNGAHPQRMVYIGVVIAVLLMAYQLFTLGFRVMAVTSTSSWFTTVSAGTLAITTASSSNSFTGVSVTFTSQTATAPDLGGARIQDARGSGAGWSFTLSGQDWGELNNQAAGGRHNQLDYDSTGADGNLGKMCMIATNGAIRSQAGQNTAGITKGSTNCFSASVTSLTIYTASSGNGKGDYWITDFSLQQFIPSNPTAQNLTTTLTFTLT